MTKLHASEERLATLRTYRTRRGPELRMVQARPAGHRLVDELPPRRQAAPRPRELWGVEIGSLNDVAEIAFGVIVLGVCMFGVPFLLLVMGQPR